MDAVGRIGGDEEALAEGHLGGVRGARLLGLCESAHELGEEGGAGAVGRVRPDLLVVEEDNRAGVGVRLQLLVVLARRDQRLGGAEGGDEVVEARRVHELLEQPADGRRLRVRQQQLEVDDRQRVDVELLGEGGEEHRVVLLLHRRVGRRRHRRPAHRLQLRLDGGAEDGLEVVLLVELEGLVHLRVQVDRQRRDSQHRLFEVDQSGVESAAGGPDDDAACEGQVSVEPSVPEAAAIELDIDLEEALLLEGRDRFRLQARAVGMRTN
mmetsp:Transcript_18083/g.31204  ORF Transcript_18083/g.31204 Transcript_18083/m.31204 type:complete len:267 (-) Transcript_18083:479-1279(-)